MIVLTDGEFQQFQRFIYDIAGISLSSAKKTLVSGRLAKRLQQLRLDSFGAYFALLAGGHAPDEVQAAVDLLTTNETYFFREPGHFEQLRGLARAARRPGTFRVWSAACSSGEEAYSIAMVLDDCLGGAPWEVLGTDISTRVLRAAATGHYPMERARHIPPAYLKRYCLKGIDSQQGTLLVERRLRERVHFRHANLNRELPGLGQFDAIFLRNVMIYFNDDTKRRVVARLLPLLKPDGHFYVGCSESLNDISDAVAAIGTSSYRKK
jgi:chemotaxis protein methyltransferase CheR